MAPPEQSCLVTLEVLNDSDAIPLRSFDLRAPDYSIGIGRGKSGNKELSPSTRNAWFDSRVMSRDHATLYADATNAGLYIKERGSMHGTFVEGRKLSCGVPTSLSDEDTVIFGADIARGPEFFKALEVLVTYQWVDDPYLIDSDEEANAPAETTNTFSVPEDDSEDDNYMVEFVEESIPRLTVEVFIPTRTFAVPESDASCAGSFTSVDPFEKDEDPFLETSSPNTIGREAISYLESETATVEKSAGRKIPRVRLHDDAVLSAADFLVRLEKSVPLKPSKMVGGRPCLDELPDDFGCGSPHFEAGHCSAGLYGEDGSSSTHRNQIDSDELFVNDSSCEDEDDGIPEHGTDDEVSEDEEWQSNSVLPSCHLPIPVANGSNTFAKPPEILDATSEAPRAPSPSDAAMVKPSSTLHEPRKLAGDHTYIEVSAQGPSTSSPADSSAENGLFARCEQVPPASMDLHPNNESTNTEDSIKPTTSCRFPTAPLAHFHLDPWSTPLPLSCGFPAALSSPPCNRDASFMDEEAFFVAPDATPEGYRWSSRGWTSDAGDPTSSQRIAVRNLLSEKSPSGTPPSTELKLKRKADEMLQANEGMGCADSQQSQMSTDASLTDAQPREFRPLPSTTLSQLSELVIEISREVGDGSKPSEGESRPRKRTKRTHHQRDGMLMKYAVTALAGIAIGAIGAVVGLVALPTDFFV